jgi:RNA polymerase sigma-70 factor (ECF subfamily)
MQQERVLIRRLNQGDIQALREVYDLTKHDLMTLAKALVSDTATAEDVVHEVFARLVSLRGTIRIRGNLRGYLFRAVANTARNALRARTRLAWASDEDRPEPIDLGSSPEQTASQDEEQRWLIWAMGRLPSEQREAVLLRHYCDMHFRQIAESQGVSVSTAQARYRYGIERLRSLLDGGV